MSGLENSGTDAHRVQQIEELRVTFKPELYLQRRAWVFDVLRREKVTEVADFILTHRTGTT